jgi:hypothetical protein
MNSLLLTVLSEVVELGPRELFGVIHTLDHFTKLARARQTVQTAPVVNEQIKPTMMLLRHTPDRGL